jgi:hypothetical protein
LKEDLLREVVEVVVLMIPREGVEINVSEHLLGP